jgi:hypothetical protein
MFGNLYLQIMQSHIAIGTPPTPRYQVKTMVLTTDKNRQLPLYMPALVGEPLGYHIPRLP